MKKLAIIFISLFLLLAACQANDPDAITLVGQDNEHPIHRSDNENFTLPEGEELAVDISDIEKMNIGPEMPRL
ncbi:hypothetical protein, partial [Lederbergia citrea]